MSLTNAGWELGQQQLSVRLDVGSDHWMLAGQGDGNSVGMSWVADAHLLLFLEDLASSSFAVLTARDGSTIAQFSLSGSRKAIEAMKSCVVAQIGRGLAEVAEDEAAGAANPF